MLIDKINNINKKLNSFSDSILNIYGTSINTGGIPHWPNNIKDMNTSGGSSDVIFYDYDGTKLYSYTKTTFLKLRSLPQLPSHPGLICQGWNWNLEDAQAYVQRYGFLNVCTNYITDDGKTRLYIDLEDNNATILLYFNQITSGEVKINWGDGSNEEIINGTEYVNISHIYTSMGSYVIAIEVLSGNYILGNINSNNIFYSNTDSALKRVEIGSGFEYIADYAFQKCISLQVITIPNSVTSIGQYAFSSCYSLKSVAIPNSVTSIGQYAFSSCYSLKSVAIPNSVTSIGQYAFSNCYSLKSVAIPNSVTSISRNTFTNCHSLQSIIIPEGVTSIGYGAFQYCSSLRLITIPEGVTSIEYGAFQYCSSLRSITIPEGVTSIGQNAFGYCYSLQSVIIPSSVTSINSNTFSYCYSLQSVIIPGNSKTIQNNTFSYCSSLQSVIITEGVTKINNNVFISNTSLKSISIPEGVTSIGYDAFNQCTALQSIIIPSTVTYIGGNAFRDCTGMQLYDFSKCTQIPSLADTYAFDNINQNCKILVPTSLYNDWVNATNWSTYANNIVVSI